MKKVLSVVLCVLLIFSLSGCYFAPPNGWTKKHHTYDEILQYSKSIDPNAVIVSEKYIDTNDEFDWEFREWDAVINGVECHVASVSDWVMNRGLAAGEFSKFYYRIDSDYEYTVLKNLLNKSSMDWKIDESIRYKYHCAYFADLVLPEYRMLNDNELELLWQTVVEINSEYEKYSVERKIAFSIPSPVLGRDQESNMFIINNSYTDIKEFTEEGKKEFLQKYKDNWDLLNSDLPLID